MTSAFLGQDSDLGRGSQDGGLRIGWQDGSTPSILIIHFHIVINSFTQFALSRRDPEPSFVQGPGKL